MITVTMEQIIDFRENINFFSNATLPLKGAYKINKIKKASEKEAEFYGTRMQEIIDKYAKRDENGELIFTNNGEQIQIKEDLIPECNKALEELQQLEIQVENYNLKIEDLGEDLECTPEVLETIMPFMD